jgi:hypothetical protein
MMLGEWHFTHSQDGSPLAGRKLGICASGARVRSLSCRRACVTLRSQVHPHKQKKNQQQTANDDGLFDPSFTCSPESVILNLPQLTRLNRHRVSFVILPM